jgi:hypothetical protein
VQPEQSVRTLPFARTLATDAAMPVLALELEEPLADMTMAALRHAPHTVDACHRTPGPHGVSPECIHTPRGTLPRRTPARTPPLFAHGPLPSTPAGVALRLAYLVVHGPQARASIAPHRC